MHTRVGTSGARQPDGGAGDERHGLLQLPLHGMGINLGLPAVIGRAVKRQPDKIPVVHYTMGCQDRLQVEAGGLAHELYALKAARFLPAFQYLSPELGRRVIVVFGHP